MPGEQAALSIIIEVGREGKCGKYLPTVGTYHLRKVQARRLGVSMASSVRRTHLTLVYSL